MCSVPARPSQHQAEGHLYWWRRVSQLWQHYAMTPISELASNTCNLGSMTSQACPTLATLRQGDVQEDPGQRATEVFLVTAVKKMSRDRPRWFHIGSD